MKRWQAQSAARCGVKFRIEVIRCNPSPLCEGFDQEMREMGKNSWTALLATVSLHGLAAGVYWDELTRVQAPPAARQESRAVEVQLYVNPPQPVSDAQQLASDMPSPVDTMTDASSTTKPPAERVAAASEPSPPVSSPSIFPAPELPYLPAGTLDTRPRPEAPVVVPFPDAQLTKSKVTGILVLYIEADGRVDRVEVDQSDLPPAFEKAAIEAFRQARMQPGIKDGQPTRARMKVLVEFEAR
jgi:TonB family protein